MTFTPGTERPRVDLVGDTPPVLVGSEVLYLSQLVDQAIYVVRWGHTRRDAAMKGLRQLLDMGAPVAGVVLSLVNTRRYRRYVQYSGGYLYRPTAFGKAA
jgi:polysaccharide biosynthesis transport protein